MDVTSLPFNRLIGLEPAPLDSGHLVTLPASAQYTNHLGTVHASAMLALAEAGSAEFLLRQLGDEQTLIPVVRRLQAKFRHPARGRIAARASVDEGAFAQLATDLLSKGRALVAVDVEVVGDDLQVALSARVEWFISRM